MWAQIVTEFSNRLLCIFFIILFSRIIEFYNFTENYYEKKMQIQSFFVVVGLDSLICIASEEVWIIQFITLKNLNWFAFVQV